jgi:hypothetical protein
MRITGAGDYHVELGPGSEHRAGYYGLVSPDGTFTTLLAPSSRLARYEAFYLVMTEHAGDVSLIEMPTAAKA